MSLQFAERANFTKILVGGISRDLLRTRLLDAGVQLNEYAIGLFNHPALAPPQTLSKFCHHAPDLSGMSATLRNPADRKAASEDLFAYSINARPLRPCIN
jgi:hypothetical protein